MLAGQRGWWAWNPCKICGCWWRCWRPSTLWCGCLCQCHFYVNQYCGSGVCITTCPFHSFQNRVWIIFELFCSWMSSIQSSFIATPVHRQKWHFLMEHFLGVARHCKFVDMILKCQSYYGSRDTLSVYNLPFACCGWKQFWQCNWDTRFIFTPFMNQSISLWCACIDYAWRQM